MRRGKNHSLIQNSLIQNLKEMRRGKTFIHSKLTHSKFKRNEEGQKPFIHSKLTHSKLKRNEEGQNHSFIHSFIQNSLIQN